MGMSITENAGVGAGDKRLYKGAPSAEGVQASNRVKRGSWRVAGASDRRISYFYTIVGGSIYFTSFNLFDAR